MLITNQCWVSSTIEIFQRNQFRTNFPTSRNKTILPCRQTANDAPLACQLKRTVIL